MSWLNLFECVYILNLPHRADRRREMEHELRRPDLGLKHDDLKRKMEFFPALRPGDAHPFPSIGAKGCFLSHLAILQNALGRGFLRILVLEDDAEFSGNFGEKVAAIAPQLERLEWGLVQFGHSHVPGGAPGEPQLIEFSGEVQGAHCYAVSNVAMARLAAHLEEQLQGVPGDNLRGPMPFDGSLNVFRWLNTDIPRHLVSPSLVQQRSSRSDITPGSFDRIPYLAPLLSVARRMRRGFMHNRS
jgi:glycosyl transferase, family 25